VKETKLREESLTITRIDATVENQQGGIFHGEAGDALENFLVARELTTYHAPFGIAILLGKVNHVRRPPPRRLSRSLYREP
jgi:hypothetical protein